MSDRKLVSMMSISDLNLISSLTNAKMPLPVHHERQLEELSLTMKLILQILIKTTHLSDLPLAVRHEMQIEALTNPGLTNKERIERFSHAAGFDRYEKRHALALCSVDKVSPAYAVWTLGDGNPMSLFGSLPGCGCVIAENLYRREPTNEFAGIPTHIDANWYPTVEVLRRFAAIQQRRRSA